MTIESLFIKLGSELEFGISHKDLSKKITFGTEVFNYHSEAEFADLFEDSEGTLSGVQIFFPEDESLYSKLTQLNNVEVDNVKGNVIVYFGKHRDLQPRIIGSDECENNYYVSIYSKDDTFAVLVYNLGSADLTEDSFKQLDVKVLDE